MGRTHWAVLCFAALLVTACGSASVTSAPSSPAAAPSSTAPAPTAPAPTAPAPPPATSSPAATTVYLAPAQSLSGTPLIEPACATPCALSGDSTAFLTGMTWQSWTASEATGSGTYKLDDCQPKVRWFWSRASFTFPKGLPTALQGQNAPQNPWDFTALSSAAQQSCG